MNRIDTIRSRQNIKAQPVLKKSAIIAEDPNKFLKTLVWVYFILWIVEGALRKWIIPALSMPLLLVRDPVVLWLLILSVQRGIFKMNIYSSAMIVLGFVCFGAAIFVGHGNYYVALYGARTLILYFPMIFVIGQIFTQEDVIKLGKWVLYIAIPMTLLLGMQFYSPQNAWVNRGVGGDEDGAGFGGALGYFRPPGTFSFTNGTTCFYSMVAPFLVYFWLHPRKINRLILLAATGSLVVAIPLSISRGLFFQVAVTIIFLFMALSRNPKYLGKIFLAGIGVIVALAVLSNLRFFQTATAAFTDRFTNANETEGGLVEGVLGDRFLGQLVKAIVGSSDQPFFGVGIGSGTTLGANLLLDDKVALMADFEWMREIGELGLIGLLVIGLRVALGIKLSLVSYEKLKNNDILPWLLMSVGVVNVVQGQWHQATILGFCALIGGLWMASLRGSKRIVRK